MSDDLARFGLTAEQIAQLGHAPTRTGPCRIRVLRANARTVAVYRACTWQLVPIFDGSHLRMWHADIPATEISAAMEGWRVRPANRTRVFRGVKLMAATAQPMLNEHG